MVVLWSSYGGTREEFGCVLWYTCLYTFSSITHHALFQWKWHASREQSMIRISSHDAGTEIAMILFGSVRKA